MVDFSFVSVRIRLRGEKDIHDPWILYRIKPHFEPIFRRLSGCCSDSFHPCQLNHCAYHAIFARNITADPAALKKFQKPSLPFAFSLPILSASSKGSECWVRLVLVGSAVNHVSLFIATIQAVLKEHFRHLFSVVDIATEDYEGRCRSLLNGDKLQPERMQILTFDSLHAGTLGSEIRVTLKSPLVILSSGKPLKSFTFSTFIRPLFRRISSLAYYYSDFEMQNDFAWLASESARVQAPDNQIKWKHWGESGIKVDAAGLGGSCIFRGDLTEFYPFLLFGQYVHVGKGASYGYGWYEINAIPSEP